MKKLLLAAIVGMLSSGLVEARWSRRSCGPCPRRRVSYPRRVSCPRTCPVRTEPVPPKCCKTIMVDKVIQVPKVIEVPAQKIVTPVADVVERIPQPPRKLIIPQPPIQQPDVIEYRCQPDKIVYHKQEPCVRYKCPVGCD